MAGLKDIMVNVLARYEGSLYNSALTKLIYLADITAVYLLGKQVTDIEWTRNNFGPFVWDVLRCARANPDLFEIDEETDKRLIVLKGWQVRPVLSKEIEDVIDRVVTLVPNPKTNFMAFKKYVYDTPPMIVSQGFGDLDVKAATLAAREVDETEALLALDPEYDEAMRYLAK